MGFEAFGILRIRITLLVHCALYQRFVIYQFLEPDLKTSNLRRNTAQRTNKTIEIQRIRNPSFMVKVSNLKYTAFVKSKISLK